MRVYLSATDAEEWPDGTFGGPRPEGTRIPDPNAAQHRAELVAALKTRQEASVTDIEPSGCLHCGLPERGHMQRWKLPVGWHKWEPPIPTQIKARMLARRAAKKPAADTQ